MKSNNYTSRILRNGFIFADNSKGNTKSCRVYECGGGYIRNIMLSTEQVQSLTNEDFRDMLERYGII